MRTRSIKKVAAWKCFGLVMWILVASFILLAAGFDPAQAVTVPQIKIDAASCQYSDPEYAYITGEILPPEGQKINLYSRNKKKVLDTCQTAKGGSGRFKLRLPEKALVNKCDAVFYIKATAVRGTTASGYIPVTIKYSASPSTTRRNAVTGGGSTSKNTTGPKKSTGNITATAGKTTAKTSASASKKKTAAKKTAAKNKKPKKATKPSPIRFKVIYYGNGGSDNRKRNRFDTYVKTGTTTTIAANRFKRNGYEFVGWATNTSRGWLVGGITNMKAMGRVDKKKFQLGVVAFKANSRANTNKLYSIRNKGRIVQLHAVWKGKGPQAAVDWACLHAADNSFAYGKSGYWHGKKGRREHCHGCYYCGTNRKKWNGSYRYKEARPGSRWDKTYCCNPFISAAYTHGANHQSTCIFGNMDYSSWIGTNNSHGSFRRMGRLHGSRLRAGDIFFNGTHVWMYAGKGFRVEAAVESWGAGSISAKKGTCAGSARGVIRYVPR